MKKVLVILTSLLMSLPSFAQRQIDSELESLIGIVCELRKGGEATFNRVRESLANDKQWTPMNETGSPQEGECDLYDNIQYFGLNRLLYQIAIERKPVHTHGDFLHGENANYCFSLYERSVRAGAKVSYDLKGREGRQCFVIVPYNKDGGGLTATAAVADMEPVDFQMEERGVLVVFLDGRAINRNTLINITVRGGAKNQAFIILTHNSRNR